MERIGIKKKVVIELIRALKLSHPRNLAFCSEEQWKRGCNGDLEDAERYWIHVREFQQTYQAVGEDSFTSFEASVTAKNLQKDFGMEFPNNVSPIELMNSCSSDTQTNTPMFPVRNQKPEMALQDNNNPQGGQNDPPLEDFPKMTEGPSNATPMPPASDVPQHNFATTKFVHATTLHMHQTFWPYGTELL